MATDVSESNAGTTKSAPRSSRRSSGTRSLSGRAAALTSNPVAIGAAAAAAGVLAGIAATVGRKVAVQATGSTR